MISGVITTRHVIRHAATIVREFGTAAYLRCCLVILRRRRVTFLECVFVRPPAIGRRVWLHAEKRAAERNQTCLQNA